MKSLYWLVGDEEVEDQLDWTHREWLLMRKVVWKGIVIAKEQSTEL